MDFDVVRILRILPHRTPAVLVDRIVDLQPGTSAKGVKCVTSAEPFVRGYFPENPTFPAVLILEAMMQVSTILAYASEPFDTQAKAFHFVSIEHAKFRRAVSPGDRMEIEARLEQRRSNIWKVWAHATVDESVCAEAEITAALRDRTAAGG